jgi:hypothetical protein
MLITDSGMFVLQTTAERWIRRLLRRTGDDRLADAPDLEVRVLLPSSIDLFAPGQSAATDETGTHPRSESRSGGIRPVFPGIREDRDQTLTVDERRARAAAVRALVSARDGRFDQARACFVEAANLDPHLDLSSLPTFWDLPRGGIQAAIEGYELAGREQDALHLAANLNYTFRPKLVRRRTTAASTAGH